MTFLRRLSVRAAGIGGAALAAVSWYSWRVETRWLRVVRLTLPIPDLPPAFDGYRIVHLSDIHLGVPVVDRQLPALIQAANRETPDLIAITGDVATGSRDGLVPGSCLLAGLRARDGVWAVLGNHDVHVGAEDVVAALEAAHVRVLRNTHHLLKRDGDRLILAGIDDVANGIPDLPAALDGVAAGDRVLLLAHEPDFARIALADARIVMQLSGHTHGGQVHFPGLPLLYLPLFGHMYPHGLYYEENRLWVCVTAGTGTGRYAFRFNCRPEIGVITLQRARVNFARLRPER